MEGIKRFFLPAIAAIVLHGFLVSFDLPNQEILKPVLSGNPIEIEISSITSEIVVSEEVITQPKDPPKQHNEIIKPKQAKKKVSLLDKNKSDDFSNEKVEEQFNSTPESLPQPPKEIDKSSIRPKAAVTDNKKIENIPEDLPKEKNFATPIHKKAMPIYRQNKQPPYPAMAKRRGYEGVVLLNVLVDTEGMVSEIKIKNSSGHISLDRAALKTVKNWLFSPATEGGGRVVMWVDIPVEFQLR
ncbi:energy transducer TonB [Desulfopila inferna]|uniref:energy transducer TonB n=1 Tax=Desulfopila inferna TaxID=468528 RepID=UPI0019668035|nr:energy transducer TonB [Desulfopila inferna]MBM9604454.1 energy transducer TonB [Desulfopila inferna]